MNVNIFWDVLFYLNGHLKALLVVMPLNQLLLILYVQKYMFNNNESIQLCHFPPKKTCQNKNFCQEWFFDHLFLFTCVGFYHENILIILSDFCIKWWTMNCKNICEWILIFSAILFRVICPIYSNAWESLLIDELGK